MSENKTNEEQNEYKMKEVSELTGLSNDLLRVYEEEFNLQINRTNGRHRRYTEDDINKFISIKKKIQEQNWSYKKVRSWLNGDELPVALEEHQVKTNLEKKVEYQTELIQDLTEKLDQSIKLQVEMVKQMHELKTEKQELEQIVARRNQDLIDTLIQEKRKERQERIETESKKTFLQKIFGK
ncbi:MULTISPECIES: MerR family transcriptional regulator [Bacillus cereus group]|uniref:Transcriptional regulator n=1 Tax=Bacillus thuringiensis serovar toumanoffi TaxID=180862 RepID=A0ABD5IA74_BACTU|nr:MerR family transcriptional regulator [Bacillus thuringiensis]MCU5279081.1 MerR family transcriptional regulator [Bacillus cereus]AMR88694.1 transcriptional regulator [Bacillus thuringiensis]EEM92093.1 transcriptional regulator [Bacillus thuringiensis IBL 200]KIP29580.1 merR HTH regulatory family protein [Bacillus thuringiensis serovar morrisoni]MBG9640975.1 transcriptional regulator [Bacillus thuringiensis]